MKKFLFLVVLFCFGCDTDPEVMGARARDYYLPRGAKNVQDLGNHWYVFEFENKRFLFISSTVGESVVELRDLNDKTKE